MQSSGASMLALLLAQKPNSTAYVDLWSGYCAPSVPSGHDVVVKVVCTTAFTLSQHKASFRPDATVLFVRHPFTNALSLNRKAYRDESGAMEDKFRILDTVFQARDEYDVLMTYEDLTGDLDAVARESVSLGWGFDSSWAAFSRSSAEIVRANEQAYPGLDVWCADPDVPGKAQTQGHGTPYGFGQSRPHGLTAVYDYEPSASAEFASIRSLCPNLCTFYDERVSAAPVKRS
jgi:hypothetical protein